MLPISTIGDPLTPDQYYHGKTSRESDIEITKFKRMCPECGLTEGGKSPDAIVTSESGITSCRGCKKLLPFFIVWNIETQIPVCKAWCCKHPSESRKGIGYIHSTREIPMDCKEKVYSEATWDTMPGGYKSVEKYICTQCSTIITRRIGTTNMERNDVEWLGGWSHVNITCKTQGAIVMPWEPQTGEESNRPSEMVGEYPLTVEEYLELPYTVQGQGITDSGESMLILEFNLKVQCGKDLSYMDTLRSALWEHILELMDRKAYIPLPVGMEVHNGQVRKIPGVSGPAIPTQYQKYVGKS